MDTSKRDWVIKSECPALFLGNGMFDLTCYRGDAVRR